MEAAFSTRIAVAIYEALDIRKERIDPGQPWQNYIESHLYVTWNYPFMVQ